MQGARDVFDAMISMVEQGRWGRDSTHIYAGGSLFNQYTDNPVETQHCTYGMLGILEVQNEDAIIGLLDRTIPVNAFEGLNAHGTKKNGGTSRGMEDATSRVCTFNNTCEGPQDMIAWYQRAKELAAS